MRAFRVRLSTTLAAQRDRGVMGAGEAAEEPPCECFPMGTHRLRDSEAVDWWAFDRHRCDLLPVLDAESETIRLLDLSCGRHFGQGPTRQGPVT